MNDISSILIVRLSSMGDIIHTIPAFAVLRNQFPQVRIDWLVDERFREVVGMVNGLDNVLSLESSSRTRLIRQLRSPHYDLVIDLQGLLKSAILARLTGSDRVLGFSASYVREQPAAIFYTQVHAPEQYGHVMFKNLSLVRAFARGGTTVHFPWKESLPVHEVGDKGQYVVLVPGASWKHKQWTAESYGELAAKLRDLYGFRSLLTHGNAEELRLAEQAAATSRGAAMVFPRISVASLFGLLRRASLVVAGDTGPLHLAAAAGTPVVGLYGPTNPSRNGPWSGLDGVVSRHGECECKYRRKCVRSRPCVSDINVGEVVEAVASRIHGETKQGQMG